MVGLPHIEFADPVVVVNEDISFWFNIIQYDGSTVAVHSFVRRVSIRSTVETLNNFPHVWTVGIGHRVLEKIFPTFCLGHIDCLGSFTTSIYSLFSIFMDRSTEAISRADLALDFLTWVVAAEMRMPLKQETRGDKLGSSGRLLIFDSTSLLKFDQSTPFLRHLETYLNLVCFT